MDAILSLTLGHLCGHKFLICPDILQWPVKWHESFCDLQSVPYCSLIFKPIKSRERGKWFGLPWVLVPRAFLWASAVHPETGSSSASCQTQSQGEACLLMISLLPHSVPMCQGVLLGSGTLDAPGSVQNLQHSSSWFLKRWHPSPP